ncbi:hypothetical protein T492DRAFT_872768 [Pavlovales sp. CCMP2436]|nr:hypothetical protein T492DRAFT_872768 [Pavlovales sp. CCMP2436]
MSSALAAHFGHMPYDTVVDATSMISRHDKSAHSQQLQKLSVDPHCAFRLQKILTIGRSPYEHTVFMDADAFPCSSRIESLFDLHDLSGADAMLMPENKHTGGYNSGFMAVKSTPAWHTLTVRWHDRVARSCLMRKHSNVVGSVLDQPDLLAQITQMAGHLKVAEMPFELQACRPEMWKRGGDLDYYEQHHLPHNASILDHPPCPVAHVNPFKAPWLLPRKVDGFCDTKGLGKVSSLVYKTLKVALAFNRTDLGITPERGACIGPIEAKLNTVKPIRGIVIGAFGEVSADTHSLVKEIAAQEGRKMYALMGVSPMEAAARIKKQLIDTIGTIAARGHAQLLLAHFSALASIAAQRGNTTNSNQQIISLNALAPAHYRRSIGTRGGAQASAAD